MIGAAAASAQLSLLAASKQSDCVANRNVIAFLRTNHANVLRVILSPQQGPAAAGIECIKTARAAGYKIYISFQFVNGWRPSQVASYFNRVLPAYAPFAWAVGVGNEQDLTSPSSADQGTKALSGHGRTVGQNYRSDWDAAERVLVKRAPHAIRVYGDFSPWAFKAVEQGFAASRPPGCRRSPPTAIAPELLEDWRRFRRMRPGPRRRDCRCGARRWGRHCANRPLRTGL
jgi:hypothetical protein